MSVFQTVLQPFRQLYLILPPSSRKGLYGVVTVSLFSALFETASVASILPFMAIVMDPGIITRYVWIEQLINALGIHSQQHAVIAAGALTPIFGLKPVTSLKRGNRFRQSYSLVLCVCRIHFT